MLVRNMSQPWQMNTWIQPLQLLQLLQHVQHLISTRHCLLGLCIGCCCTLCCWRAGLGP